MIFPCIGQSDRSSVFLSPTSQNPTSYTPIYTANRQALSNVLPLPKISNPKSVDSDRRPISLTPVLSKLLEDFVSRWLFNHIKTSIDPLQFGNIKNCSTSHTLIHLIHYWLATLDNPGSTIRCCMIDFSKAFDRIADHNIILHKLQLLDIPPIFGELVC